MVGTKVLGDLDDRQLIVAFASATKPDAIFVEVDEAGCTPSLLALLADLHSGTPDSKIIVCAASIQPSEYRTLASLGVRGYVLWRDLDFATLHHSLDAVLNAELTVASRSVPQESLATGPPHTGSQAPVSLSEREQKVLNALAEGLTQKEIALSNQLSVRTVKRTVAQLEEKLAAPSPFVLGVKARSLGLVSATS